MKKRRFKKWVHSKNRVRVVICFQKGKNNGYKKRNIKFFKVVYKKFNLGRGNVLYYIKLF